MKTISPADAELSQQEQPQPEPEGKTSDTQQGELYGTGPGIQSQPKTPDLLQQVHPTKAPPQLGHKNSPDQSISDRFITEVPVDSNGVPISSVNPSDLPAHLTKDTALGHIALNVSTFTLLYITVKPSISPTSSPRAQLRTSESTTLEDTNAVHSYSPAQEGFPFAKEHTAYNLDTNPIQLPPRPRPPGSSHIRCLATKKRLPVDNFVKSLDTVQRRLVATF